MKNDWYFSGLYHTQLNYAEWLILYLIIPYSTKLYRMIDTLLDWLNYAEWLILYWIVPYSTKLCRMIDTLWLTQLNYFIGLYHTQLNYAEWLKFYWIVPYSTKLCGMIDTLWNCPMLN